MTRGALQRYGQRDHYKGLHAWAYTGGSSGDPIRVPYSIRRSLIRTATVRVCNEQAGYRVGDPYLFIRAKKRRGLVSMIRNETVFLPNRVTRTRLDAVVKRIHEGKLVSLIGYPSIIHALAQRWREVSQGEEDRGIKSCVSTSEPLVSEVAAFIEDTWECTVADRYSNEEVGIIAQQLRRTDPFVVNPFGLVVEIVNLATGAQVPEGSEGSVVVTDLKNDLIPVIRYDTGDRAVAGAYADGRLRRLTRVVGRRADLLFTTDGEPVAPLSLGPAIYKPLSRAPGRWQYQFAQLTRATYELRLKGEGGSLPVALQDSIRRDLVSLLGADAQVRVTLTSNIDARKSGKRPIFVNESDDETNH